MTPHRHDRPAAIGSQLFFALAACVTAGSFAILHLAGALLPWKQQAPGATQLYVWNYAIDLSFAAVVYLLITLLAGQLLPRDVRGRWIGLAVVLWLFFWSGIVYNDLSGKTLIWTQWVR